MRHPAPTRDSARRSRGGTGPRRDSSSGERPRRRPSVPSLGAHDRTETRMIQRFRRPRAAQGGRLGSIGQDFDRGHKEYVANLTPGNALWLRTKPFSAPPNFELATCLRTFSHVVEQLGLGLRAQVLDVGCGPGWMSEYLARCGYWVTGIDVSEDMVEIARERITAIAVPISESVEPLAEFHAMPVRDLPWVERFDA